MIILAGPKIPEHWKKQLEPMGDLDQRYLAYLANQLKNVPEGDLKSFLQSKTPEKEPLPLDPFAYEHPGKTLAEWAAHHFARGNFDLTARPLPQALEESRKWGSTFSEIEDDLGDGWKAIRRRNPKTLKQYGEDLDNCVEKGHYIDDVSRGRDEMWIIVNGNNPVAMIRTSINSDGSRTVTDIKGPSNRVPNELTQRKIQTWLNLHPNYSFSGYTPEEEDYEFQRAEESKQHFMRDFARELKNNDISFFLPYATSAIIAHFAKEIVKRREYLPEQNLDYIISNYPRRIADVLESPEEIAWGNQYPILKKTLEAKQRNYRSAQRLLRLAQTLDDEEMYELADRTIRAIIEELEYNEINAS